MNVVAHNLLAMNSTTQFGINYKKLNNSTEKLSSGYKVNRAADDAAGLSISEKMRNQIRNLNQAAKNVEDGASLIRVADGAMNEIHSILGRQRELLVKAANEIYTKDDYQAIEDEITELGKELDSIFEKTDFNSTKIFQGKDTIINGPNTTQNVSTDTNILSNKTESVSEIVWLAKGSSPSDTNTTYPTTVSYSHKTDYEETETVNSVNDEGYTLYDENSIYRTYEYTDKYTTTVDEKYIKQPADSSYTRLLKPAGMVGSNGYINIKNEAGNLNLSCAMSQLGVKIDGVQLSLDLYDSSYPKVTSATSDGKSVTTTYKLGAVDLSQIITLQDDNSYDISYEVVNNDSNIHNVDVRLAFDTLNTQTTATKNSSPYKLETDIASIDISVEGPNLKNSVLGDISDLYDIWDDSHIVAGKNVPNHTGVGAWWSATVDDNQPNVGLGNVKYGPITLLKDPYQKTITTTTSHVQEVKTTTETETTTILPQYLNIQDGANAGERTAIRLFNLSSDKLKYNIGINKDISAFHGSDSLNHVDRVVKKISAIRSYYGAMQNRLEFIYNNDLNYSENLQSAESSIRDTDMPEEMTIYSKQNILIQAAQAMLAQANNSNEGVLSLL